MKELFDMKYPPPTLDMVKAQCLKIGLPDIEAEKFHAYYESNGWKVGRNKMQSWTSALMHWKLVWRERGDSFTRQAKSIFELKQKMEAKQRICDELKRKFTHISGTGQVWENEEARKEYIAHRKEISEINRQIAES